MSEPFIAEIRIFAGNFAPRGWAFCDGQLLSIAQNNALFALVGTIYGGDGRTTLALPDLRGRAPMGSGNAPGLSGRAIGQVLGSETAALTAAQIPSHDHILSAQARPADQSNPTGNALGVPVRSDDGIYANAGNLVSMAGGAISSAGGGQAHTNLQPYLAISYIIALQGLFPSRS